jgi:phosphomannomutase/phosphoglucomutase
MKKFASDAHIKNALITKIDGVRADFENGWGILRASNTTPNLVMRFEANSEEILQSIKDIFVKEILKIDPTLEMPNETR